LRVAPFNRAVAGEQDFLAWITPRQKPGGLVERAAGDDLAVLRWPGDELLLAGVDQVLDTVHFDSRIHSPRDIGRKAMNRNLSDCAAMAALPAAALATVALPAGAGLEYAKELYLGIEQAGAAFDCPLVGGDTGSWAGKLAVTVTIFGRSAGVRPITRGSAQPGDTVYVTGALGGSLLGRHMNFEPRVHLARQLAQSARLSSMIDLSDGLSRDLRNICRCSGVGAILDADAIPIHPDAVITAKDGRTPLEHALHDGEDYELLLTCPLPVIPLPGLYKIGVITADTGIFLRDGTAQKPLEPLAWEHPL
jgi:thiamine-monophosphate kinase